MNIITILIGTKPWSRFSNCNTVTEAMELAMGLKQIFGGFLLRVQPAVFLPRPSKMCEKQREQNEAFNIFQWDCHALLYHESCDNLIWWKWILNQTNIIWFWNLWVSHNFLMLLYHKGMKFHQQLVTTPALSSATCVPARSYRTFEIVHSAPPRASEKNDQKTQQLFHKCRSTYLKSPAAYLYCSFISA